MTSQFLQTITAQDLTTLSVQAQASERQRLNRNLHPELADPIQRLFNALEPGTYARPHRHDADRWECFVHLRGHLAVLVFDDAGQVLARSELTAGQAVVAEIPGGAWHSVVALEPGTLLFEIKPGPYSMLSDKNFAAWAPPERHPAAVALEAWMRQAQPGQSWNNSEEWQTP